jgi:hypothetical protein
MDGRSILSQSADPRESRIGSPRSGTLGWVPIYIEARIGWSIYRIAGRYFLELATRDATNYLL